jgi:hypothetical protein
MWYSSDPGWWFLYSCAQGSGADYFGRLARL